jgi:hypothetical protein
MKLAHSILFVGVITFPSGAALADLDGHTLKAQWLFPGMADVLEEHEIVVGDAIELTPDDIMNDSKFAIDLTGNTVTFLFNAASNWTNTAFNGWRFIDADGMVPEITGYEVSDVSGGIGNVGQIVPGYDADAFWADFGGMTVAGDGEYVTLTVQFADECPADINGDGMLNILDFIAFQAAWMAMEDIADCDNSGTFNILDFICYQGVFAEGCP